MNPLKKLFKQTAIYGLATVLPRMFSFLLVPLYTSVMAPGMYGEVQLIFMWFVVFNVFLAYGMETAFFRFYKESDEREQVVSTSLISLLASSTLFLIIGFLFKDDVARVLNFDGAYVKYVLLILFLDTLVIVPFAWLRANERPMRYAIIKIINVAVNLSLNVFFILLLPKIAVDNPDSFLGSLFIPGYEITYILISNVTASALTLLLTARLYFRKSYVFDYQLWKKMMVYALPVMIAGIAFSINEVFNRYLLTELLPEDIAKSEMGKYAACIKLAMFMTLFATAFRLGIEPFFFSHSDTKNPQKAYAQITNYFVILGSLILLFVVVFSDLLKLTMVRDEAYWDAMSAVPIVLLASFCLGIYHNLSVWYKITDRTKFGAYISSIGALLTIIINLAFIPAYGYMASAIATLVAYGSMMTLSFYLGKKYYPVPYNMRKIYFYGGISILFSLLSFYVFNRNLITGSLLLLVFLGLIYKLEGDKLKTIFFKRAD
ncbi:lipopolysaccharide biosynthesis protein [Croceitalea rosinachiae]|uniref:Oligosaccharide flippase family protein n=1 Tax=Croceitalea rosinachiae TaxID=3075596 RepID=A0ABU3A8R9_9FLAO|nr:oligosaccharide flippase family protein [Croceitalea sp. F388]MDT0606200.1 oligosaccharide flippase family protein [Croceitalea sp. F388]